MNAPNRRPREYEDASAPLGTGLTAVLNDDATFFVQHPGRRYRICVSCWRCRIPGA